MSDITSDPRPASSSPAATPDATSAAPADLKQGLTAVLGGMLAVIEQDNAQAATELAKDYEVSPAVEAVRKNDPEGFYFALLYPQRKAVDGLLQGEGCDHRAQFLFTHSSFIESHLKELITRYEGGACSADKSRMLLRAMARSLRTGKEIVFDYSQKYTYHLPTKVFTTHAEIMAFFDALYRLYFGRFDAYLTFLGKLPSQSTSSGEAA